MMSPSSARALRSTITSRVHADAKREWEIVRVSPKSPPPGSSRAKRSESPFPATQEVRPLAARKRSGGPRDYERLGRLLLVAFGAFLVVVGFWGVDKTRGVTALVLGTSSF